MPLCSVDNLLSRDRDTETEGAQAGFVIVCVCVTPASEDWSAPFTEAFMWLVML